MKYIIIIVLLSLSLCFKYNREKVKEYAEKYWNNANHQCSGGYLDCTPYSYFGNEFCGYESHGGDSANFVSQCILAGGHPYLNKGDCRGYPCNKEEVGSNKLESCLKNEFGWQNVCGYRLEPPDDLQIGDIIAYHKFACDSDISHIAVITTVEPGIKITSNSNGNFNIPYTFLLGSMPYIEYLYYREENSDESL